MVPNNESKSKKDVQDQLDAKNSPNDRVRSLPSKVEPSHLHENGKLFTDDEIKKIKKKFNKNKKLKFLKKNKKLKFLKAKTSKHIEHKGKKKEAFSVIKMNHPKTNEPSLFAIYLGGDKRLGTGGFGAVKLMQDLETGEWMAAKVSSKKDSVLSMKELKGEAEKLRAMGQPVQLMEKESSQEKVKKVVMGMEFIQGEDMQKAIVNHYHPSYQLRTMTEDLFNERDENDNSKPILVRMNNGTFQLYGSNQNEEWGLLREYKEKELKIGSIGIAKSNFGNGGEITLEYGMNPACFELEKHYTPKITPKFEEKQLIQIAVDCVAKVKDFNENYIHRDIKPANIMIDEKTGKVSLIDFGDAIQCPKGSVVKGLGGNPVGTGGFMAPEIFKKKTNDLDGYNFIVTSPDEDLDSIARKAKKNEIYIYYPNNNTNNNTKLNFFYVSPSSNENKIQRGQFEIGGEVNQQYPKTKEELDSLIKNLKANPSNPDTLFIDILKDTSSESRSNDKTPFTRVYSSFSDTYSLGVTLAQILNLKDETRREPPTLFSANDPYFEKEGTVIHDPEIRREIIQYINRMISDNDKERPSLDDALEFFKKIKIKSENKSDEQLALEGNALGNHEVKPRRAKIEGFDLYDEVEDQSRFERQDSPDKNEIKKSITSLMERLDSGLISIATIQSTEKTDQTIKSIEESLQGDKKNVLEMRNELNVLKEKLGASGSLDEYCSKIKYLEKNLNIYEKNVSLAFDELNKHKALAPIDWKHVDQEIQENVKKIESQINRFKESMLPSRTMSGKIEILEKIAKEWEELKTKLGSDRCLNDSRSQKIDSTLQNLYEKVLKRENDPRCSNDRNFKSEGASGKSKAALKGGAVERSGLEKEEKSPSLSRH